MNIRSQVSMVFHLDKCIGCHTCSVACKNVWTDRKGTEYMWWNNVETKPGTGYPTKWEDQEKYKGGWERTATASSTSSRRARPKIVPNIFHNPHMPSMDDYYEPWTYDYQNLFNAPEGSDQPTAEPISMIDGEKIDVQAGPNWDDDLGGSPIYAANDPNLEGLTEQQRLQLSSVERLVFFYLPRICNHCLNPCCVASCPSGALYKRGEDGIVLIDQKSAGPGDRASPPAPTRRRTSTGSPARARSAFSAFRGSRRARRRPVSIRAWVAFAIWACCCTTPTTGRGRQTARRRAGGRPAIADPRSARSRSDR